MLMRELSVIEEVLLEEYRRSIRIKEGIETEQKELPKGSLQKKNIHGSDCYYLQYREGDKVKSSYVPASEVETVREQVNRRRENKLRIRNLEQTIKQLEKALGKEIVSELTAEGIS